MYGDFDEDEDPDFEPEWEAYDDDDDDVLSDWPDCHMHNGSCGKAGSEECDWECPNSRLLK